MTIVRAFPRLHLALMDLGCVTHRAHGGAGFYIDGMPIEVEVYRSRETRFLGVEQLDNEGQSDLRVAVDRMRKQLGLPSVTIHLRKAVPQHVGLGSKTATILGTLKAMDILFESHAKNSVLQELSGRGGTSGIGINAFFSGGFLVDCGHFASSRQSFVPSSRRSHFRVPPLICRAEISRDWFIYLVLLDGHRLSSVAELAFFRKNTPIGAREVLLSLGALYHGIVPAVLEADLKLLKESLREIHSVGFKARELQNQVKEVKRFIKELDHKTNLAVGMSSLGPLVYALGVGEHKNKRKLVEELANKYGGVFLGAFHGRNRGFEVVE